MEEAYLVYVLDFLFFQLLIRLFSSTQNVSDTLNNTIQTKKDLSTNFICILALFDTNLFVELTRRRDVNAYK